MKKTNPGVGGGRHQLGLKIGLPPKSVKVISPWVRNCMANTWKGGGSKPADISGRWLFSGRQPPRLLLRCFPPVAEVSNRITPAIQCRFVCLCLLFFFSAPPTDCISNATCGVGQICLSQRCTCVHLSFHMAWFDWCTGRKMNVFFFRIAFPYVSGFPLFCILLFFNLNICVPPDCWGFTNFPPLHFWIFANPGTPPPLWRVSCPHCQLKNVALILDARFSLKQKKNNCDVMFAFVSHHKLFEKIEGKYACCFYFFCVCSQHDSPQHPWCRKDGYLCLVLFFSTKVHSVLKVGIMKMFQQGPAHPPDVPSPPGSWICLFDSCSPKFDSKMDPTHELDFWSGLSAFLDRTGLSPGRGSLFSRNWQKKTRMQNLFNWSTIFSILSQIWIEFSRNYAKFFPPSTYTKGGGFQDPQPYREWSDPPLPFLSNPVGGIVFTPKIISQTQHRQLSYFVSPGHLVPPEPWTITNCSSGFYVPHKDVSTLQNPPPWWAVRGPASVAAMWAFYHHQLDGTFETSDLDRWTIFSRKKYFPIFPQCPPQVFLDFPGGMHFARFCSLSHHIFEKVVHLCLVFFYRTSNFFWLFWLHFGRPGFSEFSPHGQPQNIKICQWCSVLSWDFWPQVLQPVRPATQPPACVTFLSIPTASHLPHITHLCFFCIKWMFDVCEFSFFVCWNREVFCFGVRLYLFWFLSKLSDCEESFCFRSSSFWQEDWRGDARSCKCSGCQVFGFDYTSWATCSLGNCEPSFCVPGGDYFCTSFLSIILTKCGWFHATSGKQS